MRENNTGEILMKRGWHVIGTNPSIHEVMSVMVKIEAEDGISSPPELDLEYSIATESGQHRQCDLLLLPAFHATKPIRWIAHFMVARSRGSNLLACHSPTRDTYEVRTCVGCEKKYQAECLLENSAIIHQAIDWFLKHRSMCPNLAWIDYDTAVRDP